MKTAPSGWPSYARCPPGASAGWIWWYRTLIRDSEAPSPQSSAEPAGNGVHFMTNLLTRVPRRAQPWVATIVRTIYQQPSPDEVHAQLDRVTDQLQNRFPQVASLLDEAGPDVLAFSSFPLAHWKKIWSNNPQERLNKEIRRRTDVVGIFPNRPAVRRLVGAVLAEQHDEWAVGRRYITPVALTFNEALPEADLAEGTAA